MTNPEQDHPEPTITLLYESAGGKILDMGDGTIGIIGKDHTEDLDPEVAQVPGAGRGPDERIVVIGSSVLDAAFGPNLRLQPPADDTFPEQT